MKTAKIFKIGNSQPKKKSWSALSESLKKFTNDFMGGGRRQPPLQKRNRVSRAKPARRKLGIKFRLAEDIIMRKQRATTAKENIRRVCGMLKSETSVTKALLKERARDKKREERQFKKPPEGKRD